MRVMVATWPPAGGQAADGYGLAVKIAVDGRALRDDAGSSLRQARGIARYAGTLLRAMRERHRAHEWTVAGPRSRLSAASAALLGRPRLATADVVWLPAPAPVAVSPDVPYVLTVHDLAPELRPRDFSAYARLFNLVASSRRLARGAATVVVDSEETRAQVLARWRMDPARVALVRPGYWRPPSGMKPPDGVPERYLLYAGALEPRKGLGVLTEAYAAARRRGLECTLILAGDGPLRRLIRDPDVMVLGRVSDDELAALYHGAQATVLPSYLEGFGFTPLESLAAGTPVVVSDLPALRETLGNAALTVPPGDSAALADALMRVDGDDSLRSELLVAAQPLLDTLSWDRAADELYAVLEAAADA